MTTQIKKVIEVDDRPWDEKIEKFDGDFKFVKEKNEDGTIAVVIKQSTSRRRKKPISEDELQFREGRDYPLEIWFLISDYLKPEDVRIFASICHSSYSVVCSAKFWFNLYRKFYRNTPNLPERLQPECMVRMYGLKACVIRALYHMYPLFIYRVKSAFSHEEHPQSLLKRQCVLMWHSKTKDKWMYSFKLKLNRDFKISRNSVDSQPDLLEMLDDVLANSENGCRILQICCPHFMPTPLVLGLTLKSATLTYSEGFRTHRLNLRFGSGLCYGSHPVDVSNSIEIMLDSVLNWRVLDWWHPLYPHNQTTPLLNQLTSDNECILARQVYCELRL